MSYSLAELCICAACEAFRGDGEVLATGIGVIPRLAASLAMRTSNPDLMMTDSEAFLLSEPNPLGDKSRDFRETLNPHSLEVLNDCPVESSLENPDSDARYQFERLGYFHPDPDSRPGYPVFNRIVTLRDTWAKLGKQQ